MISPVAVTDEIFSQIPITVTQATILYGCLIGISIIFTRATLSSAVFADIVHVCLSVRPSVTTWSSTKTYCRITQTTPNRKPKRASSGHLSINRAFVYVYGRDSPFRTPCCPEITPCFHCLSVPCQRHSDGITPTKASNAGGVNK